MTRKPSRLVTKSESGFTLIELLVVILIIGILAAIAVPQYFKVVEKGKASEALATLDSLRSAQERYLAATGNYCDGALGNCGGSWDISVPLMKYFTLENATAITGNPPGWNIKVVRKDSPAVYGKYTITYSASGGAPTITCTGDTNNACQADLMPQ